MLIDGHQSAFLKIGDTINSHLAVRVRLGLHLEERRCFQRSKSKCRHLVCSQLRGRASREAKRLSLTHTWVRTWPKLLLSDRVNRSPQRERPTKGSARKENEKEKGLTTAERHLRAPLHETMKTICQFTPRQSANLIRRTAVLT